MARRETTETLRDIAEDELGFRRLRAGQEEAAAALVEGHDVLAVMPTGAGKSAIYQLAGAAIPGVSIVVSPLLALQHDQVTSIGEQLGGAVQLNSLAASAQRAEALERIERGDVEFVFLAPEQLANDEARAAVEAARPSLFVVDEAHCISSWGHDFRPDYLRLGAMVDALGHPRVLALTATAAPPVRAEILEQLHMEDPVVIVRGFRRPNIRLEVRRFHDPDDKRAALVEAVATSEGTGIVYTASRNGAEDLARHLSGSGVPAVAYHAGLPAAERAEAHERFKQGERLAMIATTAFGMGIDAPHVRWVFHDGPAESIDAYYQELGRAGRDGAPARAVVFTEPDDRSARRFFAGTAAIDEGPFRDVAALLSGAPRGELTTPELADLTGLSRSRLATVLDRLSTAGALELGADGSTRWTGEPDDLDRAARAAHMRHEQARTTERTRAEMVQRYLDSEQCRWQFVLGYFGEPEDEPCGRCDACEAREALDSSDGARPFPSGSQVRHDGWGLGTVVGYERDVMTVLFEDAGYRTLSVPLVLEGDLLTLETG